MTNRLSIQFRRFVKKTTAKQWQFMLLGLAMGFLIGLCTSKAHANPPFDMTQEAAEFNSLLGKVQDGACRSQLDGVRSFMNNNMSAQDVVNLQQQLAAYTGNDNCTSPIVGFVAWRKRVLDRCSGFLNQNPTNGGVPTAVDLAEFENLKRKVAATEERNGQLAKKIEAADNDKFTYGIGFFLLGLGLFYVLSRFFTQKKTTQTTSNSPASTLPTDKVKSWENEQLVNKLNLDLETQKRETQAFKTQLEALSKDKNNPKMETEQPSASNEALQKALNEAHQTIAQLRAEMESMRSKAANFDALMAKMPSKTTEKSEEKGQNPPPQYLGTFYLSLPNNKGEFSDADRQTYFMPGASFYEFRLIEADVAEFKFYNQDFTVRDAMNHPELYLEPVCQPVNARPQITTSIETNRWGKARLSNGWWVMESKAQIVYK
jgi:hypothetical protein